MRVVLRVRKKGILILPKKLREEVGLREGDEVVVETRDNTIIMKPLRPLIVDVDPKLVDEILKEEYRLEEERYKGMLESEEVSS